ncbi:MAG: hypothetical protein AB1498_11080 [bacterium]
MKILNISKIEKAVYCNDVSILKKIKKKNKFSRIYFGEEFCPFRLPTKEDLESVIKYARKNKLQFTFVTPWLTDDALARVRGLLEVVPFGSEVVINDYGLLLALKREKNNFIPVLGRLLNGQIRGLRANYERRLTKNILKNFQSCHPQIETLADFYKNNGINRIELDNLPQGIKTGFENKRFSGSLYYPYGYITVTRFCPYIILKNRFNLIFSIKKCNKTCLKSIFPMENKETDRKIFVIGNSHFFKNNNIPKNLSELGIDRLVEELF